MSALVAVAGHHSIGGSSADRCSTQDVCFGPQEAPHIDTLPLTPIAISHGAACRYCPNGTNVEFPHVAGVLGDEYAIVGNIVDDGMIIPDGSMYIMVN